MIIGDRLRELRMSKQLSQGDIEKRTGLLRCYLSRVENGHTVPAIETLEKMARALEVPMYQLFYDGEERLDLPKPTSINCNQWGVFGREARELSKLRNALARMQPEDRKLLFHVTRRIASRKRQPQIN